MLFLTLILFTGSLFLLLQTQTAKNYIADRTEVWFNETFEGTLEIGEIDGLIPFNLTVRKVVFEYDGHTPLMIGELTVKPDIISVIRESFYVRSMEIRSPQLEMVKSSHGSYTLESVFQRTTSSERERSARSSWHTSVEAFVPTLQIIDGSLRWPDWMEADEKERIPDTLVIHRLNADFFLELNQGQRLFDISYLTMEIKDFMDDHGGFTLSGQIYNDAEQLEFNSMRLGLGRSYADWSSTLYDVDLFSSRFVEEVLDARFMVTDTQVFIEQADLSYWIPELALKTPDIFLSLEAYGDTEDVRILPSELSLGETQLSFEATIQDYRIPEQLTYEFDVLSFLAGRQEFLSLLPDLSRRFVLDRSVFEAGGRIHGDRDSLYAHIRMDHHSGQLNIDGKARVRAPYGMEFSLQTSEFDLNSLYPSVPSPTILSLDAFIQSTDMATENYRYEVQLDFGPSVFADIQTDSLSMSLVYHQEALTHTYRLYQDQSEMYGSGVVDISSEVPHFLLDGSFRNVNLASFFSAELVPETELSMDVELNWHGMKAEEGYGRISADIFDSKANATELRAHQFFLDLNAPDRPVRSLRFTSSVFDLLVEGEIEVTDVIHHYDHWYSYFVQRIGQEFLLERMDEPEKALAPTSVPLKADVVLELKDLQLLRAYVPALPDMNSQGLLMLQLASDSEHLQLEASWEDRKAGFEGISLEQVHLGMNASFEFDQLLRKEVSFLMDMNIGKAKLYDHSLDDIQWDFSVKNDTLLSDFAIGRFGKNISFYTKKEARYQEGMIEAHIQEFMIGNEPYQWSVNEPAMLQYNENGSLVIDEFILESGEDRLSLQGILSPDSDEAIKINIENVNLARISDMIAGEIGFDGRLNADFTIQSILREPAFFGDITVEYLAFDGRTIGDVYLSSRYNPERNRVDTDLRIFTDPSRYSVYREANQGRGHDITAVGWVQAPDLFDPEEPLVHLDVNISEVDLWVLMYVLDGIFESIEGTGSGQGYLAIGPSHIDFHGDFDIDEAIVEPIFFETEYELSGPISVGSKEGVHIQNVSAHDFSGGTGVLSGHYDFNDFEAEKFMDITLSMNNLIFLNNAGGDDVPFYGTVAGTGVVNISGSNISPYVRTIDPVSTSSRSRLSIPLADQVSTNDYGRFIHFVKSFDDFDFERRLRETPEELRQIDRTFMEVFRLDLQFIAASNSTVQLIFDPVTGEIVNARGSGRVRITLEDENLQIFGNYDISDGDYLFVGGDIITRRFTLREGGSIRWDGDPV
ncbi:translocation/assembly module TamB domain-containing protein, partial [Balneolaceae bacterium ANBcel3]|nr:translocation/assembly module TamB domain-containing protein [Balneolaceae bacterium ANBcel3]